MGGLSLTSINTTVRVPLVTKSQVLAAREVEGEDGDSVCGSETVKVVRKVQ